jgi:CBS domain-containing protein
MQDARFGFHRSLKKEDVISVRAETSVQEVARLMRHHHVGDILVVDETPGRPQALGIINERDLALAFAENETPHSLRAADVMSRTLATAHIDTDFMRLVTLMNQHGVQRLPLTDAEGAIVKIVTAKHLLQILTASLFEITQVPETLQVMEVARRH